jgi:hypothetical protein
MKRVLWDRNPTINFWIENDPIRFYYGTPLIPERFQRTGIMTPSRWVSLSLVADRELRRVGEDGHILVIELPTRWMMDHMNPRLDGNDKTEKDHLLEKELYTKWTGTDSSYYAETTIRIANLVPSRYIIGFTKK